MFGVLFLFRTHNSWMTSPEKPQSSYTIIVMCDFVNTRIIRKREFKRIHTHIPNTATAPNGYLSSSSIYEYGDFRPQLDSVYDLFGASGKHQKHESEKKAFRLQLHKVSEVISLVIDACVVACFIEQTDFDMRYLMQEISLGYQFQKALRNRHKASMSYLARNLKQRGFIQCGKIEFRKDRVPYGSGEHCHAISGYHKSAHRC